MRFLTRKAKDVETRYGGRFVNAIDGVRSQTDGRHAARLVLLRERHRGRQRRGRARGACRRSRLVGLPRLERGDARAGGGRLLPGALPARLRGQALSGAARLCAGRDATSATRCATGSSATGSRRPSSALGTAVGKDTLRLVSGEWADVRVDAAARKLEDGPAESGVFARPVRRAATAFEFELLDAQGRTVADARPGRRAGGGHALRGAAADVGRDRHRRRRGRARRRAARPRPRCATASRWRRGARRADPAARAAPERDDADRADIPRHRLAAACDARGRRRRVHARAVRGRARHPTSADAGRQRSPA